MCELGLSNKRTSKRTYSRCCSNNASALGFLLTFTQLICS